MSMVRSVAAVLLAAGVFAAPRADAGSKEATVPPRLTARGQAVSAIVTKWAPVAYSTYGVPPSKWARAMGPTFARAPVGSLTRAAKARTYGEFMGMLSVASTPTALAAPVPGLRSPATSNLAYTVMSPCRLVDTRNVARRFTAGETRSFKINGAGYEQGGASTCHVPVDASAVALNVTAVYPDDGGFLTVFPSDKSQPLASSLNYRAGDIVANEIVATVGRDDFYAYFSVYSKVATDVVVDVAGYFSASPARALDCQQLRSDLVTVAAGSTATAVSPVCPTGYLATGGGCNSDVYPSSTGLYFFGFGVTTTQRYGCSARNQAAAGTNISADVVCCRVPGR